MLQSHGGYITFFIPYGECYPPPPHPTSQWNAGCQKGAPTPIICSWPSHWEFRDYQGDGSAPEHTCTCQQEGIQLSDQFWPLWPSCFIGPRDLILHLNSRLRCNLGWGKEQFFVGSLVSLGTRAMGNGHRLLWLSINQSMQGEVCFPPARGLLGSSVLTGLVSSIPALLLSLATQANPKLPPASGQHTWKVLPKSDPQIHLL